MRLEPRPADRAAPGLPANHLDRFGGADYRDFPGDPRFDPRLPPPDFRYGYPPLDLRYGLGGLPPLPPRVPLDPYDRGGYDHRRPGLDLDRERRLDDLARREALLRGGRDFRDSPFDRGGQLRDPRDLPFRDPYGFPEKGKGKGLDKGDGKGGKPRMSPEELLRKAIRNTKISQRRDGCFVVRLYATEVVQIPESPVGTAILHSGGHKTLETLGVINEALEPFAFKVVELPPGSRQWEVRAFGQPPVQFTDGMTIHETAKYPIDAEACERKLRHLIDSFAPPRTAPREGRRDRSRSRDGGAMEMADDDEEVTEFQ